MRLLKYTVKRLLFLAPVMLGVLVVTFIVARILPADPIYLLVPADADKITVDAVRRELGLDKPVYAQFIGYLKGVVRGDLGTSIHTGNPVTADIRHRFPATLELTLLGLALCVFVSIPLGVFAAVRRDGLVDHVARIVSLVGVSLPSFWLALLLVYLLFFKLGWAPPPLGRGPVGFSPPTITGMYSVDTLLAGDWQGFLVVLRYLALPVISLALINMAPLTRLTRSSMIEALGSEYVRFALAAGIPKRTIYFRLALKNALLPPITLLGIIVGFLLGGAVIIETIFAWPGLGLWAVNAAMQSDYAPVQAFALLAAGVKVIVYLLTDLVYFAIDPRIRY
ncbi:MAG: ABC transporter permease [Armatimonadota bacterium]|nr:ABC transporter permease [Armatimonadota bacterium]